MSKLILRKKEQFGIKFPIPYYITVNGTVIGITRLDKVQIEMPSGNYNIGVRYSFPLWKWTFTLSSETDIVIKDNETKELMFFNREHVWNILFDIDLILWIAELFFTLPHPWNIVYKVLSNGFFVLWIIRIILIRKRYFYFNEKSD